MDSAVFYDESRVAVVGVGLCYPGRLPKGGDCPPRPVCAPLWHPRLLPHLSGVRLTLAVGGYAIARLLGRGAMTSHVAGFRDAASIVPLPHPSWRTIGWEKQNPWFAEELLPSLRLRVAALLAE